MSSVVNARALKGKVVEGLYPAANYRGVNKRFERRRVLVLEVRNTIEEPLDEFTRLVDPELDRSEWLVTGVDIDKRRERSFYLASFSEWRARVPLATETALVNAPTGSHVIVLIDRDRVVEVADSAELPDAGRWLRSFNRLMRRTPWRAAIVESKSLDHLHLPAAG